MTNENKKKYNPTIGGAFTHDSFGEGSIKIDITADGLAAITQNLQVGGAILLKYNKVTAKGNKHYFTEILPPYDRERATEKTVSKKAVNSDLD